MPPRDDQHFHKYLLEHAEVTKYKNDQSNPKNGSQTRKLLIKFTVRPSHVQSQNHLKKSGQIHQKHTHDQWRSAARVSMSKCTNPCYMTHRVLKARMNHCINQNLG